MKRATETLEKTKEIISDIDSLEKVSIEQLEDVNESELLDNYNLYGFGIIYKSTYSNEYFIKYVGSDEIDTVNKQGLITTIYNYLYNI